MNDFLKILVEYWSQIAVLLGIIFGGGGFILKLYFNWSIKKKEITYNKIRETKIKELRRFYSSYVDLEIYLKNLQFATAQNRTDSEKEIRNKLPEIWRQFYLNFTFLRIFLNQNELKVIEDLNKELENIQLKLDYYQIDREFGEYDGELIKELRNIRDNIFPKRIPELLRIIETNLKKDFQIE